LLENAAFRQFAETIPIDDIKFWRTAQQNEVDFIIREQQAYEVKASASQFKAHDYSVFRTKYPDIPLHLVSYRIDPKQTYPVPAHAVWQL
jgi:predicted AAA+ superfamily ATPase